MGPDLSIDIGVWYFKSVSKGSEVLRRTLRLVRT